MASWTALLLVYLFGGVTLIPLLLAAFLLHAYYAFPIRDDSDQGDSNPAEDDIVQPGDDLSGLKEAQKLLKDDPKRASHHEPEVAAGYFAVCREYTPMGINAKPIERSTPVGSTTVAPPSPSVYQTMYRSIFDRKQSPGPLDHGYNGNAKSQRPKKAGNVFYVVLRHGHLMLFDDDDQVEVRHVISLAHHDISIYSGGDTTPEGELFIKKNALCLSRKTQGVDLAPDAQLSKPFYLFSENCSAKEDFYFALLRNQEQTFGAADNVPRPMQFDVKHIISLVQKLHSSEDHLPTRWLNAMIGRVFLGVYKTADLENFIREKITKKISRVKRPTFLSGIRIKKIETGDAAPYITNPRLKDLTVEGEYGMEADVRYTGNFRIEVAATARIDLGSRFKAREVTLVLSVVLKKLEGHILFKIKPPPSNRIWFSFQQMPKVEMALEPIISSRQITWTVILRQIENRIKEVIAESIVLPFWDDVPFFRTERKKWRGGIWEDDEAAESPADMETTAAHAGDVDDVDRLEETGQASPLATDLPHMEKSHSVPVLESTAPAHTGLFGRKLNGKAAPVTPKGNASSTSVESKPGASPSVNATAPMPRPIRSASFAHPPTPVTGTDITHADLFKPSSSPPNESPAAEAMASLSARSLTQTPERSALTTPHRASIVSQASSHSSIISSREATDTERDNGHDDGATPKTLNRRNTTSSAGSTSASASSSNIPSSMAYDGETPSIPESPGLSARGSLKSQAGSLSRGFFARRDTSQSTTSSVSAASNGTGTGPELPKRNALAAVTNAAASARRWGINALQRHNEGRDNNHGNGHPRGDSTIDLTKPMGGGRPLPPPGVPLPMPDRRHATVITPPTTVPRRKLPPPPLPERPKQQPQQQHPSDHKIERKPVPPPLPKRRQPQQELEPGPIEANDGADDGDKDAEAATSDAGEDSMLVVAAPMESEPNTPAADETANEYMRPWAEDAEDEEAGEDDVHARSHSPRGLATAAHDLLQEFEAEAHRESSHHGHLGTPTPPGELGRVLEGHEEGAAGDLLIPIDEEEVEHRERAPRQLEREATDEEDDFSAWMEQEEAQDAGYAEPEPEEELGMHFRGDVGSSAAPEETGAGAADTKK